MKRSRAPIVLVALVLAAPLALDGDAAPQPALTRARAIAIALATPKIASWLHRYPSSKLVKTAQYHADSGTWDVAVFAGAAGEAASASVDDASGRVTEALAGPQVAWQIARGGGVGGKTLNRAPVWLAFCFVFLIGLADLRRPLSVRNLDLFALLAFSFSLWAFNKGHVFAAASLAYPPIAYLIARCLWITRRGRRRAQVSHWPVWILVAATVFLASFRLGLDLHSASIIDVGYAGVIGAERIADGRTPYDTFPQEDALPRCRTPGDVHERIQSNGRCERALPTGDTYGPVTYEAYVPGLKLYGWTGKWDRLPAARFTTIVFDLLALAALAEVGRRFGGARLAATLAFGWVAYPFTQYAANSGTNDVLMPALLLLGFLGVTSAAMRGAALAAAGWAKFAAFILAPLWLAYPVMTLRRALAFAAGFVLATIATVWVVFLDGRPVHAIHTFYERTISIQFHRSSPFSIWDWAQYHAGLPDLHVVQRAVQIVVLGAALIVPFVPRRKNALQLAALTGALILGFEASLTHWTYYYVPWFFPFVLLAVLATAGKADAPALAPPAGKQSVAADDAAPTPK